MHTPSPCGRFGDSSTDLCALGGGGGVGCRSTVGSTDASVHSEPFHFDAHPSSQSPRASAFPACTPPAPSQIRNSAHGLTGPSPAHHRVKPPGPGGGGRRARDLVCNLSGGLQPGEDGAFRGAALRVALAAEERVPASANGAAAPAEGAASQRRGGGGRWTETCGAVHEREVRCGRWAKMCGVSRGMWRGAEVRRPSGVVRWIETCSVLRDRGGACGGADGVGVGLRCVCVGGGGGAAVRVWGGLGWG